jgi:peptidoglycan-N-acetylmuramic acid deacetylase
MFVIVRKRHILLIVLCCLLLISAPIVYGRSKAQTKSVAASAAAGWGLSFQGKDGNTPVVDAKDEDLKPYQAFYRGDPNKKVIYLTFDCGYENGYTPAILDALKKHNVKATFFVVGNYINTSPDLVKRMVQEGHIVGNHTFHHPDMTKKTDQKAFAEELDSLAALYEKTTGQPMKKFYRPPEGRYTTQNLKMANDMGYKTIFWSLAYVDWYVDKQPSHEEAMSKLTKRIHPGAIVLLHSTSKTNSEILDELLTKWEADGYTFGTLEDLGK